MKNNKIKWLVVGIIAGVIIGTITHNLFWWVVAGVIAGVILDLLLKKKTK